jgi:hypothetical protein
VRKVLFVLLSIGIGCTHSRAAAPAAGGATSAPGVQTAPVDPRAAAAELSADAHALLRAEGELLWKRWTTGAGPLPSSALAEHPRLSQKDSLDLLAAALQRAVDPVEIAALRLLHAHLETLVLARETSAETDALDRARAALSFAAPGDARPDRGERDLDRLLTDEPAAARRAAIALAEAKAAQALAPLALARDQALAKALSRLSLGSWQELQERTHGLAIADLAALAEQTLTATEAVAARAVSSAAQRNLGVTPDRLRRSDLPRLVRSLADASFTGGRALPAARATLGDLALLRVQVDAEPSPSKGARPLALLVDPPADVRLSLRPAGGFEEQRATLHEAARAHGAALTATPRWELAQLGDGGAAEAVAALYEQLAGDPQWLREATLLRGEPLDDLVHTQAARRVLLARRAAALVLFEIRRRAEQATPEATAALYRGLVQRATMTVLTDEDAARWALESDPFLRAATALQAAVASAQLERALRSGAVPASPQGTPSMATPPRSRENAEAGTPSMATPPRSREAAPSAVAAPPAAGAGSATGSGSASGAGSATGSAARAPAASTAPGAGWWHSPQPLLQQLWSKGRSATALDVARALGASALDPTALAAMADTQLAYRAPEAPPPTERPDYKFMQGDRRTRRKKHTKKRK